MIAVFVKKCLAFSHSFEFLSDLLIYTWKLTYRMKFQFSIFQVYNLSPELWDQVNLYLLLVWDFILEYSHWMQGHIATLYTHTYLWVETNILK